MLINAFQLIQLESSTRHEQLSKSTRIKLDGNFSIRVVRKRYKAHDLENLLFDTAKAMTIEPKLETQTRKTKLFHHD